jgi:hypothetical protein
MLSNNNMRTRLYILRQTVRQKDTYFFIQYNRGEDEMRQIKRKTKHRETDISSYQQDSLTDRKTQK